MSFCVKLAREGRGLLREACQGEVVSLGAWRWVWEGRINGVGVFLMNSDCRSSYSPKLGNLELTTVVDRNCTHKRSHRQPNLLWTPSWIFVSDFWITHKISGELSFQVIWGVSFHPGKKHNWRPSLWKQAMISLQGMAEFYKFLYVYRVVIFAKKILTRCHKNCKSCYVCR